SPSAASLRGSDTGRRASPAAAEPRQRAEVGLAWLAPFWVRAATRSEATEKSRLSRSCEGHTIEGTQETKRFPRHETGGDAQLEEGVGSHRTPGSPSLPRPPSGARAFLPRHS